jgi:para-aminobenzoate synthetase component 1
VGPAPVELLRRLRRTATPGTLLFEGGPGASTLLLAAPDVVLVEERPGHYRTLPDGRPVVDPFAWLRARAARPPVADRGPFRGGLAGLLGFELAYALDDVHGRRPSARTPALWVGDYAAFAVRDARRGTWEVFGPREHPGRRALEEALAMPDAPPSSYCAGRLAMVGAGEAGVHYRRGVRACQDLIASGELFEISYSERFEAPFDGSAVDLYAAMSSIASGAHHAFLDAGAFQIASVSPERAVAVDAGEVETRPIKGSAPRDPENALRDAALGEALLASAKDRAENVMIVDLARNDLTRVCELGSVAVTELCALESFQGIHHLVSTVRGRLAEGFGPLDALLAAFPLGSISGAPKLRAVEVAAELEGSGRGSYTGSLFWASRHGRLDASVLIRTAEITEGALRYGVGGAVTTLSDPAAEWAEALLKREVLDRALREGRR